MELTTRIKKISYDSIKEIDRSIINGNSFEFLLFDNYDDGPEDDISLKQTVGIHIQNCNADISATLFIDMTDNEAYFLAKGILAILEARK